MDLDSVEPLVLYVGAAIAFILAIVIGWFSNQTVRASRDKRVTGAVTAAIIEYFRRSGVEVAAGCVSLRANKYTAFVESEPMKRFRLSHIIEATLRDHIQKTCGLELDKIYWRFPIKQVTQPPVAADAANTASTEKPANEMDEYINEGLVPYKDLPKVEALEVSLEDFEKVTTETGKPENTQTPPNAA